MKFNATKKDYRFVDLQLLLFVLYFLPLNIIEIVLPHWLRYLGWIFIGIGMVLSAVALLQLNSNLSPFPSPVPNGKLITTGAFSISRHPIYTAILLGALGYAVYCQSLFKTFVFLLLVLLFYYKSKYEEQLLANTFPEYGVYKKRARRFL